VIADRGYDSNAFRSLVADLGATAVIPAKSSRITNIRHDAKAYRLRNRIERCFNKLKHFRRIATRYDRRDVHFSLHFISPAPYNGFLLMSIQPSKGGRLTGSAFCFYHLRAGRACGQTDSIELGNTLQPRCDVDAIAHLVRRSP
jgi:hypothetical protein